LQIVKVYAQTAPAYKDTTVQM